MMMEATTTKTTTMEATTTTTTATTTSMAFYDVDIGDIMDDDDGLPTTTSDTDNNNNNNNNNNNKSSITTSSSCSRLLLQSPITTSSPPPSNNNVVDFPDVYITEDGKVVDLPTNITKKQSPVSYNVDFPDVLNNMNLSSSSSKIKSTTPSPRSFSTGGGRRRGGDKEEDKEDDYDESCPDVSACPSDGFERPASNNNENNSKSNNKNENENENNEVGMMINNNNGRGGKSSGRHGDCEDNNLIASSSKTIPGGASSPNSNSTTRGEMTSSKMSSSTSSPSSSSSSNNDHQVINVRTSSTSTSIREYVQMGISKRTDFPLIPSKMALLIIDVQTYCCKTNNNNTDDDDDYYTSKALPEMISNISKLANIVRTNRNRHLQQQQVGSSSSGGGSEVIFTMIQSQTTDGRDLSLDYKLSGPYFQNVPKVHHNEPSQVFLHDVMPQFDNDIIIPKTSCSVFMSTNLDYVLRQLFIEQIVICGQLTEQCVESAVRDAADLGYFVTVVDDACATYSQERHQQGLKGMNGFCRICSTQQVINELTTTLTSTTTKNTNTSSLMIDDDDLKSSSTTTTTTTTITPYNEIKENKATSSGTSATSTSTGSKLTNNAPPPCNFSSSIKRRIPIPLTPPVTTTTPHHLEDGSAIAILKTLSYAKIKFMKYISMDATNTIQSILISIDTLKQQGSLNYPWNINNNNNNSNHHHHHHHNISSNSTNDDDIYELQFQPDPSTLQFNSSTTTAIMFGTIMEKKKTKKDGLVVAVIPSDHCTRHLLDKVVQNFHSHDNDNDDDDGDLAALKYLQARVELSFTLNDKTTGNPIDNYVGDMASSMRLAEQQTFISTLYDQLKEQEINILSVNSGSSAGQLAVNLGYQRPLNLADQLVAMKEIIIAVAQSNKWVANFRGNGTILSFSLPRHSLGGGKNENNNNDDTMTSLVESQFLAGVSEHLHALSIISRGPMTTMKEEVQPRSYIPKMCWSSNSQQIDTALMARTDPLTETMSIQYRLCDSSFNPYVTLAGILACGGEGIRNGVQLANADEVTGGGGEEEEDALPNNNGQVIHAACLASNDFLLSILGPAISRTHLAFRNVD